MPRPKLPYQKRKKHRIIVRLDYKMNDELEILAKKYGSKSKAIRALIKKGL